MKIAATPQLKSNVAPSGSGTAAEGPAAPQDTFEPSQPELFPSRSRGSLMFDEACHWAANLAVPAAAGAGLHSWGVVGAGVTMGAAGLMLGNPKAGLIIGAGGTALALAGHVGGWPAVAASAALGAAAGAISGFRESRS